MNKNRMRLTESQLHKVIKESVKIVLHEGLDDINEPYTIPTKLGDMIHSIIKKEKQTNEDGSYLDWLLRDIGKIEDEMDDLGEYLARHENLKRKLQTLYKDMKEYYPEVYNEWFK